MDVWYEDLTAVSLSEGSIIADAPFGVGEEMFLSFAFPFKE